MTVVGVVAIVLAWVVVKHAAVDALVRKQPALAAAVAPDDPRVALALAMLEFRQRGGMVSPTTLGSVQSALRKSPIAEEPLILAAVQALLDKDGDRAELLLREASRRNPRSRIARLLLLDRALRADRIAEATGHISVLSGLIPEANRVMVPELAKFAADPQTSAAVQQALRAHPNMRAVLLDHLAATGADPQLVLRFAELRNDGAPAPRAAWQQILLDSLVAKGRVDAAYSLWGRLAATGAAGSDKRVYDGRFEGKPGLPPFNWRLSTGTGGVAELGTGPELNIDYYGREDTELAAQLLMLPPGSHALSFQVEGSASGEGSRLVWRLYCLGETKPLMELPLLDVGYAPKRLSAAFSVPPTGCDAQWLRLDGNATEFPKAQIAAIRDVRVARQGGAK